MVLVGSVRFVGYREWTESLGKDREWYIQVVQSRLYQVIQHISSEYEGLALPLRYDIQLIMIPSSVDASSFVGTLRNSLKPYTPTPIRVTLLCGNIPEVLERVKNYEELGDYWERCGPSKIAIAHADINNFTQATYDHGPYNTYVKVMDILSNYVKTLRDIAIVQYLGGDNIAAITSEGNVEQVIKVLTSVDGVKVGVGISEEPRNAFALAAEALAQIRSEGRVRKYHILKSGKGI